MSTQAITKPEGAIPKTVKGWLTSDYFKKQVALCLPKHLTADRFVRVAISALTRIPKLTQCTPESVLKCMMACSELGIEPDGRRAHLIPFGNECTLIVDYKGLVELAKRSGDVSNIHAEIVCERDDFSWDTGEVKHRIDFKTDRGNMFAVYAVINFKDGGKHTEVMTKADVDRIRKRSKAANNGPWVTDYDEMAKKTVFRRASKWITLSPEIRDALERDADGFQNGAALVSETSLALPEGEAPETEKQIVGPPIEIEQIKPEPKKETEKSDLQQELAEVVTNGGYTFGHFVAWAEETGNLPDAGSIPDFASVPSGICKRLLRARIGLLKGLEMVKAEAGHE